MGLGGGRFEVYVASSRFPEQVYQKLLLDKYFRQPKVVYHEVIFFVRPNVYVTQFLM